MEDTTAPVIDCPDDLTVYFATPLGELRRGGDVRNGSGSNRVRLVSMSQPFPGHEWTALVDVRGNPGATSIVFISDRPLDGSPA